MTTEEALVKLAESTADAVETVLATLCGAADAVRRGACRAVAKGVPPLAGIPVPAVAANVSYVDGVTGGNVFAITRLGARRLAAAMTGMAAAGSIEDDGELTELELSAVGEAGNQMMAAAASATGSVLGQEIEIGAPETRQLPSAAAADAYEAATFAAMVPFTVFGEPCRLVLLVPNAFVVRMMRAFDERAAEAADPRGDDAAAGGAGVATASLRDVRVRVWAELGRARLEIVDAVGLAPGTVVTLDREAGDPVDLFVNGRRFALGQLLLGDDSEWAVRVDSVLFDPESPYLQQGGN